MQSCINENQKIYELGNGRFMIMDLVNHSKEDILELYDELKKSIEVALEENAYRMLRLIKRCKTMIHLLNIQNLP